jgi:hypothetical protein
LRSSWALRAAPSTSKAHYTGSLCTNHPAAYSSPLVAEKEKERGKERERERERGRERERERERERK